MDIARVLWLPEIEDKLSEKHHVLVEEVEAVLFGAPHIHFVEKGHREGQDVYAAYGQTEAGRYLVVLFVLKSPREALILSARDMDGKERKLHGRRQGKS
ncbi:MAG: BrnT family toxin [Chloroflexi bacterium]|nr:BrnT family toxin [Chloroflexota bacterium]